MPDPAAQTQAVARLMALPNQSWDTIIAAAAQNPAVLQDVDTLLAEGAIEDLRS